MCEVTLRESLATTSSLGQKMIFQSLDSSTSVRGNSWKIKALQLAGEIAEPQGKEGDRGEKTIHSCFRGHGRCVLR